MKTVLPPAPSSFLWISLSALALLAGCAGRDESRSSRVDAASASNGPADQGTHVTPQGGTASGGQHVFRFETFGNEKFWTDAARVPKGMMADHVTPLKAMQTGLSFDADALDTDTRGALAEQLRSDPSGGSSALLNDPNAMIRFVNANAR